VNPSTMQARVLVDELVRCGVTEVVLCPGSRNAPLSFALQAADAAGRLRLHVRIDERTAGFLALGMAARSRRPVPVCTTSGTAVANLHPAVLEASHAGVPLLVLSADRPPAMIGTGASQTIEQSGLFGRAVRLALDGPVGCGPADNGRWRTLVDRAYAAATGALGGAPGPVQVNLPFAEPLVPDADGPVPEGRPGGEPWTSVPPVERRAPVLPLDPAAPTLVIAGLGAPDDLLDLHVPVIAEPSSAAWPAGLRTGPWLLGAPSAAELKPAQVVVAGRPTLHRPVQRLLADPDIATYVLADPQGRPWTDVAGMARAVGALPPLVPDPAWTKRWAEADDAAATALDRALDDPAAPSGLRLARSLLTALPRGAQLVLGSSNPVRDVSLAAAPRPGLTILSNRGVAGIDGTVSTALGAALVHDGPAYALLGDLTLLHDTTGLVIGPDEPRPDLTIVVLNDGGGGIFGLLEQGALEHAAAFERVFGTPHGVDLAALCTATGTTHVEVDVADIAEAVAPAAGVRVVEVRATRTDLREAHATVRATVDEAVAAAL
jgi:2-succinyl-5-enolpyruvyl-6-hydroxy-3-cyclohexene-1-carboxylate synthase